MSTENTDDKTTTTSATDAAGQRYEEYKKKIDQHLAELGKQMDSLKEVLSKAASDAKVSIEQEMDKLKREHAGEFERLSKLQAAGEASLQNLGSRLDKLVEDVTAAVTTALGIHKSAPPPASTDEPKADAPPPPKTEN